MKKDHDYGPTFGPTIEEALNDLNEAATAPAVPSVDLSDLLSNDPLPGYTPPDPFLGIPRKGGQPGGGKTAGAKTAFGHDVRPGYVPCPNRGSYHARNVLKAQFRAYFDADAKLWFVPVEFRDAAFAACKAAERKNAELDAFEVERLLKDVPVRGANASADVDAGVCWECGGPLLDRSSAGPLSSLVVKRVPKAGAVVDEAYCGCVGRGDQKRRHRPDFRGSNFSGW